MPEPARCRDTRVQRVLRFVDAAELLERERQPAEPVSLVVGRQTGAKRLRRLRMQSFIERLVGPAETSEHVVRMLRHHRAEGLQPRAHRATRSVIMSATRCGASSGTKCRTSLITSSVES